MSKTGKHRTLADELERLHAASMAGDFDITLNSEGLPDSDAQIIKAINEAAHNYKAAVEYDILKYKLTSDALGVGLWDMDVVGNDPGNPDNRLVWSQEIRNMLGFKNEKDFPNRLSSLTDRIHPDDRDKAIGAFVAHVTDKTASSIFDTEYRLMTKSGEYRYFRAFGTTLRDSKGNPLRVAGAVEDIDDDKKLQESLKKAEEERIALTNLGNIMDGLNAMICVTDPDNDNILFINESMRRVFNVGDSYSGKKCYEVIHGLDKRCRFCPCAELDKNPDKEVIWEQHNTLINRIYRAYSRYVKWPGGKTVHIQNAIDITDMKRAHDDLENQNLRLNLLVGGLNVGLWDRTLDPEMAYDDNRAKIWWSDEFRKLLGYEDENDFPNEIGSWLNSVHPDDLEHTVEAMTAFLSDKTGKTPYNVENRMKLKNGQYRWFRSFGSAIRDSEGYPIRTAGATEDITARHEAEREIAEQSEFNQILFDNAPVGVTLFDENFKYIDCNENILKMFGGISRVTYSKFFGSKDHSPEFQPDGSHSEEKALELVRRAVINGEKIKVDWVHNTPDGQPFPVELTMLRIKQGDKYVGLAYLYDMREQNRLNAELTQALHNAEKANKAKSDFLAKMSHEIRTPMNAILGITEIKLSSGSLSADMEESLSKIYDSGNLLMGIINDILDLSKIEADKLEILPVKYDISSLINDTVQLNRLRYESKPIEFTIKLDENTPFNLIGDELRIKQILNNLLSNAYKYTEKGGIELSIYPKPSKDKKASKDDIVLVFRVSDTGQGLTPEQVSMLFSEYMRFNQEANRTTVGTGLGLSITKSLVDMMDGEITVTSTVDEGSVFTVEIPQKRAGTTVCGPELVKKISSASYQSTAISSRVQFVREYMPYGSVLVVDDVDSNIYVTKGMMMPYGLQIDTAASGFEAIDRIKNGKTYDIIFMDHMMPNMDGMEAAKIIRDMGYKGTIVALTANAIVGQAEVFLENGFDGYISKPIDSRELNIFLNDFIRSKQSPEVVEAARREQKKKARKNAQANTGINTADLKKYVVSDVKKAVKILEELNKEIRSLSDAELELYVITVHGIKSSLANLGEQELSNTAYRLELAGKDRNIKRMTEETSAFINALRRFTDDAETAQKSTGSGKSKKSKQSKKHKDKSSYLKENLRILITALDDYNITQARNILDELKREEWQGDIGATLDEIGTHLLHSDFDKAAALTETLM